MSKSWPQRFVRSIVVPFALCAPLVACEVRAPALGGNAQAADSDHPMLGTPAPDFDIEAQAGGARASLAALRGKIVIVDFWATWCAPCRQSFPKYQALLDKHGDALAIIGISEDDEPDGIAAFAKETGVEFLLAWDGDKGVAQAYGPDSMPTSYVIDGNGLVRYVHSGYRPGDEAILDARVAALLE